MRLSTSLLGLVAAFTASVTYAGTVTIASAGRPIHTSGGATLPSGSLIRVGAFDVSRATLASMTDYATLASHFKPLAEGVANAGSTLQSGGAGHAITVNNLPGAGGVFGQIVNVKISYVPPGTPLYLWVFDAATPDTASQWGIFGADGWGAPPELGAESLSTSSTDVTAVQGDASAGQLQLKAIPATYGNWAMKKFGSAASASMKNFAADSDGDGLANLVEYAWGTDPQKAEANPIALTTDTATASFQFKNPRHLPDVTVLAEFSTDLKTWTTVASVVVSTTDDYETRSVSKPSNQNGFWRVRFASTAAP